MTGLSNKKRKLSAQPLEQLLEGANCKDWPITAKESVKDPLGRKFELDRSVVSRKISEMGISNYKREKTPKYTEAYQTKSREKSKKLANLFYRLSCDLIIDEEKYFCHDRDNMPVSARFYSDDKSKFPDSV